MKNKEQLPNPSAETGLSGLFIISHKLLFWLFQFTTRLLLFCFGGQNSLTVTVRNLIRDHGKSSNAFFKRNTIIIS